MFPHPSSSARDIPERDYTAALGVLLDNLIEAAAQSYRLA
jgi:hypothetical protein